MQKLQRLHMSRLKHSRASSGTGKLLTDRRPVHNRVWGTRLLHHLDLQKTGSCHIYGKHKHDSIGLEVYHTCGQDQ